MIRLIVVSLAVYFVLWDVVHHAWFSLSLLGLAYLIGRAMRDRL